MIEENHESTQKKWKRPSPKSIEQSDQQSVADPGGGRGGHGPPGPVKIGHKKDGHQRRLHRFHVSRPPLTRPLDPLLDQCPQLCAKN